MKLKVTPCKLEENFFLFNKAEFKFYGKQIKKCIFCYKAECNVF